MNKGEVMKRKSVILLTILLMVVGFAAVSTTLFLNGDTNIGTNQEDFDVYFSDVYIDDVQILKTISKDRKTITYETNELKTKGETSILDYEVTNASKQYDAKVEVNCIPKEDEWIHVEAEQTEEIIEARSKGVGKINVTLKQNPLEEMSITFSCTLKVEAIERESIIVDEIAPTEIQTWEFDYTGSDQEFIVPRSGEYKIELWGASGYNKPYHNTSGTVTNPSYGGFVLGTTELKKDDFLYFYVGESGKLATTNDGTTGGGYNGGGNGGYYYKDYTLGGGGATDVRLKNGEWNHFESLKSRIMIAAGGSSSLYSAGGLVGYGESRYPGGTQNSGGAFGAGCFAGSSTNGGGGSGGGYYGGQCFHAGANGAGGSSFISGHDGCDAIEEVSTEENIIHTGQANHYSGLVFTDTLMIDGNGYKWSNVKEGLEPMPKPDGTFYEEGVGHTGNGYAKITYLGK